jgi:hypothetical protein
VSDNDYPFALRRGLPALRILWLSFALYSPLDKLRDLSPYPFARGLCTSSDLATKNPFLKEEVSISLK